MVSLKTRLNCRKTREIELTPDKAEAMLRLVFRFAEFTPEEGRFRLSRPLEVTIIGNLDELTIQQQ